MSSLPQGTCNWCDRRCRAGSPLCAECLDLMRQQLGITHDDIRLAKERGFYKPDLLANTMDKIMSGLDQMEPKHWLDKSLARSNAGRRDWQ